MLRITILVTRTEVQDVIVASSVTIVLHTISRGGLINSQWCSEYRMSSTRTKPRCNVAITAFDYMFIVGRLTILEMVLHFISENVRINCTGNIAVLFDHRMAITVRL